MHTAICAFDDQATARAAMDRLAAAGIARHDMHLEHRAVDGELRAEGEGAARPDKPAPNDAWDGLEREVAVDRSVLSSFGHFFTSLFGQDNPSGQVDNYSQHIERGSVVLVVDADDEAQARTAMQLMQDARASDANMWHRPQQRPLRDILGERQAQGLERSFGTARGEMAQAPRARPTSVEADRAMAAARAGDKPGLGDGAEPGVKLKNMGRSDGI